MPLTDSLRDDILASVPSLRAFAISLSGNGDRADDLVQETLLRAIANIDSFQPGTNMSGMAGNPVSVLTFSADDSTTTALVAPIVSEVVCRGTVNPEKFMSNVL